MSLACHESGTDRQTILRPVAPSPNSCKPQHKPLRPAITTTVSTADISERVRVLVDYEKQCRAFRGACVVHSVNLGVVGMSLTHHSHC